MKRQRRAKLVDVAEVGRLLAWEAMDFTFDAQDLQCSDWYELSNATDVAQQKEADDGKPSE